MKPFWRRKRVKVIIALIVLAIVGTSYYSWQFQVLPQATIYFLDDIPAPKISDRIVIFPPHPDDETIGAGGYIATAIQNKAQVWVVLVTDGNRHGLKTRRMAEFSKSLSILGVPESNQIKLMYPDGQLAKQNRQELKEKFQSAITQLNPTVIIAPVTTDGHPDHRVTGEVVADIQSQSSTPLYLYLVHFPNFPLPRRFRPDLYLLPPIRLVSLDNSWRRFMLRPQIQDKKHEALLQYRSQLRVPILRSVMFGLVRKNELFAVPTAPKNSPS